MVKHILLSVALSAISACAYVPPSDTVRIDAASDVTAEKSFEKMLRQLDKKQRRDLAIAVVKLNMSGVHSALDAVANQESLQSPTIIRVKDRVAGMNAAEIMALADHTSELKIDAASIKVEPRKN